MVGANWFDVWLSVPRGTPGKARVHGGSYRRSSPRGLNFRRIGRFDASSGGSYGFAFSDGGRGHPPARRGRQTPINVQMRPDNIRSLAVVIAIAAVLAGGCGESAQRSGGMSRDSGDVRESEAFTMDDLDLGGDWIEPAGGGVSGDRSGSVASRPRVRGSYWTVLLRTFSNDTHARSAANMKRSVAAIDRRLAEAHVHTTRRGSMVLYGVYGAAEDEAAQADLAWIKSIELRGRRVFPLAMLTRVGEDPGAQGPYALLGARRRFPDVDPLYTLQVAIWGDFGSGAIPLETVRARAEAYTRELRAKGFEAFVHHDDAKRLSMVTVGLFDSTSLDPQSGIESPELTDVRRRFPVHLVNGEELRELVDPRRPQLGTKVQEPRLVVVPR